ncbi:PfkB family carbohydrate kinase [Acerihabitans arboris]|uniref:Ribokinase n=1 Tax=Acerihabitans arboris TaxID=2691583 RepID=A0A845SQD1_9GAMM|nr:PfkB family carbohydrate kinase [Acerihabitans arboris]NDL65154.1 ribokinase [Acerihabitans arboris]
MHVYVVGNMGVDQTYLIDELPEKGASIHGHKISQDLGGKGANQAVILARCGVKTTLIAARGNDHQGDWCRDKLTHEPLTLFPADPLDCATDTSIILNSADGDNVNITTTTAADTLSLRHITAVLADARPGDVVLQQGNFSFDKTRAIFEYARGRRLYTVFNPSPVQSEFAGLWPLIDLVVLNSVEARLLGADLQTADAARHLLAGGIGALVVTLGADGALLFQGARQLRAEAAPCRVVDTTGAGDTFLAVMLASALLRGLPVDETALRHAGAAAAITIGRSGTLNAFPTRAELSAILA